MLLHLLQCGDDDEDDSLLHLLQDGDDHVEAGPLAGVLVHTDPDDQKRGGFSPLIIRPINPALFNIR